MIILHTNEHPRGILLHDNIGERQVRERMRSYIKEKKQKGYSLGEILFCWSKVYQERLP